MAQAVIMVNIHWKVSFTDLNLPANLIFSFESEKRGTVKSTASINRRREASLDIIETSQVEVTSSQRLAILE
jgi:hypothetical protein